MAAGVLFLAGVFSSSHLWAGEGRELCLSGPVEGLGLRAGSCLQAGDIESLRNAPVIRDGKAVVLALTDPETYTRQARVSSCAAYERESRKGWFALSQRDMDRESLYKERCGLLAAMARARPARSSFLDVKGLALLEKVPARLLPRLGAGAPQTAPGVTVAQLVAEGRCRVIERTPKRVRLVFGNATIVLRELARADFSGDGYEDMLVTVSARAQGGTAGVSSLATLSRRDPQGPYVIVD